MLRYRMRRMSDHDAPVSSRTRSKVGSIEQPTVHIPKRHPDLLNTVQNEPEGRSVQTPNPFLLPPILYILFNHVSTPDLKGLRSISSLWNQMALKEMEQRALNNEYRQLRFDSICGRDGMLQFYKSTQSHPKLFRSFYFQFPHAPHMLTGPRFTNFFGFYKPCIMDLAIPIGFGFTSNSKKLLRGFATWMAPTLRELTISNDNIDDLDLPPIPEQGQAIEGILFPNLQKLTLIDLTRLTDNSPAFKILFGEENCQIPKLASLKITSAFDINLKDILGDPMRWASLTYLYISIFFTFNMTKFTLGLVYLSLSGMALKELVLKMHVGEELNHQNFGNFSQFFNSQANSLENLRLELKICIQAVGEPLFLPKINLPVFPQLATIDIFAEYYYLLNGTQEPLELFGLNSVPINFPRLTRLKLSSRHLTTMALLRT